MTGNGDKNEIMEQKSIQRYPVLLIYGYHNKEGLVMKLKSIVLSVICMLMLVGCAEDSSSEKDNTTKTTTTTTYKNLSFEATVLMVLDNGYIGLIESDYVIDSANGKIGKARLEYDDGVEVDADIKAGDKIKVTVLGDVIGMKESSPPIIFDIKSIEKIGESKESSFEATVLKADDGYITLVDAELDDGNGNKIGESKLEFYESFKVPSDIKSGDKIKVTVGGDFGVIETGPPIITDVISVEKIS